MNTMTNRMSSADLATLKPSVTTERYIAFRQRMEDMEFLPATYASWGEALVRVQDVAIKEYKQVYPHATPDDIERQVTLIPESYPNINKLRLESRQPVPPLPAAGWTYKIVRLA